VRLPLSEEHTRKIAARELPNASYGTLETLNRWTIIRARRIVEYIDAVSAWENEGGR